MKTPQMVVAGLVATGLITISITARTPASRQLTLSEVYQTIKTKQFVDLTHAFEPGIPHWKGFPNEKRQTLYWYKPGIGTLGSGFYAQSYTLVGQWGTHVDPPLTLLKVCAQLIRSIPRR